jgi:hypothetical protein
MYFVYIRNAGQVLRIQTVGLLLVRWINEHFEINKTSDVPIVEGNTDVRSCNRCSSGKAISTTYSECDSVALGTQHAMRMRHIFMCGLHCFTVFFYIVW